MPEQDDRPRRALRPTVVTPPDRNVASPRAGKRTRPAAPGRLSSPITPTVKTPTAIPGVERKRIAVSINDLRELSPAAAPGVYERALGLISTFVADKATQRKAILWGHELQTFYSDLVTETLRLSQAPVLGKVEGYLARMIDILGSIDLLAVCGHRGNSLFGEYFKGVNKKIDTAEELKAAQTELDQLVKCMSAALDELLTLKDKLEQHAGKFSAIAVEVEASALAALFLSNYLQKENSALAQRFTERGMSLTQTLAQVRSGDSTRDIQVEHPLRMIGAIQNVALVMMPAWLGSIASALTLLARRSLTQTEASELTYQLRDIINQLKTQGEPS